MRRVNFAVAALGLALATPVGMDGQIANMSDITGVLVSGPESSGLFGFFDAPEARPLNAPPVLAALCVADVRWHAATIGVDGTTESLVEALVLDHRPREVIPALTSELRSAGAPAGPVHDLLNALRGLLIGTVSPEGLMTAVLAHNDLVQDAPGFFLEQPPGSFLDIRELLGALVQATRIAAEGQPAEALPYPNETVQIGNHVYLVTGGFRSFDHYDLTRVGQFRELPVLALAEEVDNPISVYIPVEDDCDLAFQPFEQLGTPTMACMVDPTAADGIAMIEAYRRADGEVVVLRDGVRVPAEMLTRHVVAAPELSWYVEGQPLLLPVPGGGEIGFLPVGDPMTLEEAQTLFFLGTVDGLAVFTRTEWMGETAEAWRTLRTRADGELLAILEGRAELFPLIDRLNEIYVPIRPDGCLFQPLQRMGDVVKPGRVPRPAPRSVEPTQQTVEAARQNVETAQQTTEPAPQTPEPAPEGQETAEAPPVRATQLHTVQVASFTDQATAQELHTDLRDQGAPAWISQSVVNGRTFFRVRIGALSDPAEAERLGQRVESTYGWPVWIAEVSPSTPLPEGIEEATRTFLVYGL